MRKTLVALAVVISVVLLQAPAWAPTATTKPKPNIYVVQGGKTPSARSNITTRTVDLFSETCTNKELAVTFEWGETVVGKTTVKNGQYQYRATLKHAPAGKTVDTNDVIRATCDGKELPLPFTGAASASLLALGVSLLVIGALLVLSSRGRPLMRRR